MSLRKASILKLATGAYEMDLQVLRGELRVDERGELTIDGRSVRYWLQDLDGHEIVLIAGSLDEEREVVVRTCRTCGREYVEHECPYCRATRIRLRGE
jgi:hypothetical protein